MACEGSGAGVAAGTGFERAVLAAALDPVVVIDATGTIRSASDSIERVFGWTPDELVGRNVNILMPEPHRSAHDGYLQRYARTGKTNILNQPRQFDAVRKDGVVFPIELAVSRADIPGEPSPVFVGIIRDVGERVRFEAELRLLQTLTLGISQARDMHDAMEWVLREVAAATGWAYGEFWLPAGPLGDIERAAHWPPDNQRFAGLCDSAGRVARSPGRGLPGRHLDAPGPVWLPCLGEVDEGVLVRCDEAQRAGVRAAGIVPIRHEGTAVAVLLFFMSRTRPDDPRLLERVHAAVSPLGGLVQRKRTEEELAEHRRQLEHAVQERTEQLEQTHVQLRMADHMASLGTLAAGLGHDINNVLLPVRAHLNRLRERGRPTPESDRRRSLDAIRKSVDYLQQLADGLHYLATDPGESERSHGAQTELRAWWARTGALLAKAVPSHVRVEADLPKNLPPVRVAPHHLTQAVLNLVVNAGEAIPEPDVERAARDRNTPGRVRVWARVREPSEQHPEPTVLLGVTDNGQGMDEELLKRAMQMYFTTKPRGRGTGLGLPLVRRVVERSGGTLRIDSRPGEGTTVRLSLPAAPLVGTPARPPVAAISLTDPRAAAAAQQLLEAAGARARIADGPEGADIWIADASAAIDGRWRGRVVLVGQPGPDAAARWEPLRPLMVSDADDLAALRDALGRVLTGP